MELNHWFYPGRGKQKTITLLLAAFALSVHRVRKHVYPRTIVAVR